MWVKEKGEICEVDNDDNWFCVNAYIWEDINDDVTVEICEFINAPILLGVNVSIWVGVRYDLLLIFENLLIHRFVLVIIPLLVM
jgi:hypothetical protein